MVTNSDIQIWHNAVKGINESGKTDLTKEEWAALSVLNTCLSSGSFSSQESQNSYKILKDSINQHAGNAVLQKHLYDFITLCYKYATQQPVTVTNDAKVPEATTPTVTENKQSVTLKNILFGSKQLFSKNLKFVAICLLIAVALAGIIYVLNVYANVPGYVTALVVGALASITLLRKNQNGQIREKLASVGAAAVGTYMYFQYGVQISGGSMFVWTFLAVGLILSFIGKNKSKLIVWLAEVIPAALCFLAFERLGGAISGFGAKEIILGNLASVRYLETFKIFLLFCLFQSFANNTVATQYRDYVYSKWKNLLFYGMQTVIVLLFLCISLNPFKLSFFDNVKSELVAFSQPVRAGADVFDVSSNYLGRAKATPTSSALLSEHIPGYLATAYDFSYVGGFDTAKITFQYDAGLGRISEKFQPRIYYFNENDGTLEELPDQVVQIDYEGWTSVTAKTAHFSTYILLNSIEFNAVWSSEIRKPPVIDPCSCGSVPSNAVNFDVVFVMDETGSMRENDPKRLRVDAAKQFIEMMAADSKNNRAAIIGFTTYARNILYLTALNNESAVKAKFDEIRSDGGTDISTGFLMAIQEIEAKNDASYSPIIILMTDGQDNNPKDYTPLINRANAVGITVFAIGLGNDVNSTLLRNICDNTGGGVYYYAENSDVLPIIFKSANSAIIEYEKDSNGDGISDYYSQLLYDGTLRLSNGSAQFKGAQFLISNKADWDGDGFKNGEELVVTTKIINGVEQVCVVMKSDPTDKKSTPSNNHFSGQVCLSFRSYQKTTIDGNTHKQEINNRFPFFFDDNFFDTNAYIYNHNLARFSLGMAVAAFSDVDSDVYWSSNSSCGRENNIKKAYNSIGFSNDVYYNYDISLNDNSNKVAYSIASKNINDYTVIAVMIRGGGYGAEWGSNFDIGDNGNFHKAFKASADCVVDSINKYIANQKNIKPTIKLWFAGFSRGAAVANLAAALFDNNPNFQRENIFAYTFATPQGVIVKNENANNIKYNNIYNTVYPKDAVPVVPLSKWGFGRYGRNLILPTQSGQSWDNVYYALFNDINETFKKIVKNDDLNKLYFSNQTTGIHNIEDLLFKICPNVNVLIEHKLDKVINSILKLINYRKDEETMDFEKALIEIYGKEGTSALNKGAEIVEQVVKQIGLYNIHIESADLDKFVPFVAICILNGVNEADVKYFLEKVLKNLVKGVFTYFNTKNLLMAHYPEVYMAHLLSCDGNLLYGKSKYKEITRLPQEPLKPADPSYDMPVSSK